jgi:UDP-N-acetylmuramoylalanine--D-glutamate ligase
MMKAAGHSVQVGGNLGVPALNLLGQPKTDVYVLELSSFQLETTYTLKPDVATVLNITPDHMDRYDTVADYARAKHRVYHHCQLAVCNRDDAATDCDDDQVADKSYFTVQQPGPGEFGLIMHAGETYLGYGDQRLMPVSELPVMGKHYQANALAATAIAHGFGVSFDAILQVLREFTGLPHRCQMIRDLHDVRWVNDSKGTNVGATLAAIEGLGSDLSGKLVIIMGGVGKNADFSELAPVIQRYARHVVLIGEAAPELARVASPVVPVSFAQTLEQAVAQAGQAAQPHDCVLLSPACASFDMFKNYEHRGQVFMEIVQGLSV